MNYYHNTEAAHLDPVLIRSSFTVRRIGETYQRLIRYKTPGSANAFWFDPVDKMEAVDKYTVRVSLREVNALFRNYLADPFAVMMPKELVEQDGDLKEGYWHSPFVLQERVLNVIAKLRRNADYWEPGIPYLDGVNIFNIPTVPP